MRRIETKLTRDKVAAELRRAIMFGTFGPNEKLSQDKLAVDLGVSKMPVREAIQILANEGLVTVRPNKAPVVNKISDDFIRDHFDVRSILEQEAIARAASREDICEEDLQELRDCLHRADIAIAADDYEGYNLCNWRIHQIIWRLSGNLKLEQLLSQLWHTMHVDNNAKENALVSHREHHRLVKAIVDKDSDAARKVMKPHVIRNFEKIMDIKRSGSQRRYIQIMV